MQQLKNLKSEKEKIWYNKMSGFLDSDKLRKIEQNDINQQKLKHKITRKHLQRRVDDNRPPSEDEEDQENVDPCSD